MKISRVNAKLFESPAVRVGERQETPRQRKRRELEATLGEAVESARLDRGSAFQLTLERDETAAQVRVAFRKAKLQRGATEVNLVTVRSMLYIAQVPQRRGRRPKSG